MTLLNNLDFEDLRAFVAIARHASFHAATLELNISAPALTRRIQRLEMNIGTRLFERTTRRVELAPMGEVLLPRAETILREVAETVALIESQLQVGNDQLTLGCIPTATRQLLPHVMRTFHEHRPDVRIRIVEGNASRTYEVVQSGEADFSLTLEPQSTVELAFDALWTEPFLLACPVDHPLAERDDVCWADLSPYRLIVSEPGSGNRAVLEHALGQLPWHRERLVEIDHLTSAIGLVEAGLGISVVPLSALPETPQPARLAVRQVQGPQVTRTLGLLRRRAHSLGSTAQQFRRAVRQLSPMLEARIQERVAAFLGH